MSTNPIQRNNTLMITKRHIAAASITTLTLSLFTGVVGYQSGRQIRNGITLQPNHSLLPDVEQQQTLEALLMEVEEANNIRADHDYQFVRELQQDQPISIPEMPKTIDGATVIEANGDLDSINIEELPSTPLPTSGWAIQVASYPTLAEANEEISRWEELGQTPYVVKAAVNGDIWYRIRLSGFADKAQAENQRNTIQSQTNEFDYIVVKAP